MASVEDSASDCARCDRSNEEEDLVQCDSCNSWLHYSCAGFTEDLKDEDWICNACEKRRSLVLPTEMKSEHGKQTHSGATASATRETTEKSREMATVMVEEAKRIQAAREDLRRREQALEARIIAFEAEQIKRDRKLMDEQQMSFTNPRLGRPSGKEPPQQTRQETQEPKPAETAEHDEMPTARQLAARQAMPKDLPTFSGRPEEWPMFHSAFESSTRACGFSNYENLGRLQRCLKDKALEAVRSRLLLPETVPAAMKTLQMLFGRPEAVIASLMQKVREVPAPKTGLEGLITFGLAVQSLCDHIVAVGAPHYLSNPTMIAELVAKLPDHLKLDWGMYKQRHPVDDLAVFGAFMEQLMTAAVAVTPLNTEKSPRLGVKVCNTPVVECLPEKTEDNIGVQCLTCGSHDHYARDCPAFHRMSVGQRWEVVRKHNFCQQCLGRHGRKPCWVQRSCQEEGCERKHHPLLHTASAIRTPEPPATTYQRVPQPAMPTLSHESTPTTVPPEKHTLFKILPVDLHANGRTVSTFAFLDDGSSVTLVEQDLVTELGITGEKRPLCLSWTGNVSREETTSEVINFQISGKDHGERFDIVNARSVKTLQLPRQTLDMEHVARHHKHLLHIPARGYAQAIPRLLIGVDHSHLISSQTTKQGKPGEPIASQCSLGWVVYGQQSEKARLYHHRVCGCGEEPPLPDLVHKYFTLENVGVEATPAPQSDEEARALDILQRTTRRQGNRYETGLLWKNEQVELPRSYPMAMQRLLCLEKKLARKPALQTNIQQQLNEYVSKGYIHVATPEELKGHASGKSWYLPLGVVVNPKKPGKVRMIWDPAAKSGGVSLNDMLLKGPDLNQPLAKVLSGFRERRIAIGGDIQEMFHQIMIRPADRSAQRFLWRPDPTQVPQVFIMDVATFGSTCSPCSAQYVKNINAEEHAPSHPEAAKAIKDRHYVDDYLDSFDEPEDAIRIAKEVRFVHSRGGFHIRNWLFNSEEVTTQLGETSDRRLKDIHEGTTTQRVLGMKWSPQSDTFTFASDVDVEETVLTKRGILRTVMSQYDPLGLLAHLLIHGRALIQDIWRTEAGWDVPIEKPLQSKWRRWVGALKGIQEVRIPRAYFPGKRSTEITDVQIHVFVDASETAYACVGYFRAIIHGRPQVALIGAKAKVAPLKALSIPRLELQAAVIGVRWLKTIQAYHSIHIAKRFLWTDSTTLLAWIRSDHRRYRQFVAIRIGEILFKSTAEEWRWVPTHLNVADEATKWGKGPQLRADDRWFTGPPFLLKEETAWPSQPPVIPTEIELKHLSHHRETTNTLHKITSTDREAATVDRELIVDWSQFKKYEILINATAYVHRFIDMLRPSTKGLHRTPGLKSEEMVKALNTLWRLAQAETYPTPPTFDGCQTFKDEKGVMRLNTRLTAASFTSYDTRYPVVLDKGHPLTRLILDYYHRKYLHANHQTVLNEVRQQYFVKGLRNLVRNVVRSCMHCREKGAKAVPQIMAPLPEARLAPFTRPFTFVGLDYFGPLRVKVGRALAKRWVAIFTCLSVRAVHLEIAHSLTTESCVMAIQRFISRRGVPREIWSDNGTNFVGANRTLQEETEEQLVNEFAPLGTRWIFNPPAAPHMGGAWERLVRSVKDALSELSPLDAADDENLHTALKQAEGIINSRPLTYVALESESQEALTPNHFLLLASNGVTPEPAEHLTNPTWRDWGILKDMVDAFWKRWIKEYLPEIAGRSKWITPSRDLEPGDLVLLVDEKVRNGWMRGRVTSVINGRDGHVRQAIVRTATGKIFRRPVTKIAYLALDDKERNK